MLANRKPSMQNVDPRRKAVLLMNQISPGTEWCSRFLTAFDEKALVDVPESDVAAVRSWVKRIDEWKDIIAKDEGLTALPMTDADRATQQKLKGLQSQVGRQALSNATPDAPARPIDPKEKESKPVEPREKKEKKEKEKEREKEKTPAAEATKESKKEKEAKKESEEPKKKQPQPEVTTPIKETKPEAKHESKKDAAVAADNEEEEEDYTGSKFLSAGVIAFAIRDRAPLKSDPAEMASSEPKKEVVVLMTSDSRRHTVLNIPSARTRKSDADDSIVTLLRGFHKDTKNIWDYDAKNIEQRVRVGAPDLGLTSCFHQNGRYFLHFVQIPYIPNANKLFKEKPVDKTTGPATTDGLYWIALEALAGAGTVKKAAVQDNPGDSESKWRRVPFHGFLAELLQNKKVADKIARLQRIFTEARMPHLPPPPFAEFFTLKENGISSADKEDEKSQSNTSTKNDKKRKRADSFGDVESTELNLDTLEWDALISTQIESGITSMDKLKKAVIAKLSEQVRERLLALHDKKASESSKFIVENGKISKKKSNKKSKTN